MRAKQKDTSNALLNARVCEAKTQIMNTVTSVQAM